MNKTELVKELAHKAGMTQKDCGRFLDSFTELVGEVVSQGDDISILGFGNFYLKRLDARKGRNPKTGEEIDIPASKSVGFKAGKGLKEAVN